MYTTCGLTVLSKDSPSKSTLHSSLGVQAQSVMHHSHRAPPNKHMGSARVTWCSITAIPTHSDVMQRLSSYWSNGFIVGKTWKHKAFPLQIPRSFRSSWFKVIAQCLYTKFHTHLPDTHTLLQGLQASSAHKVICPLCGPGYGSYCRRSTCDTASKVGYCPWEQPKIRSTLRSIFFCYQVPYEFQLLQDNHKPKVRMENILDVISALRKLKYTL